MFWIIWGEMDLTRLWNSLILFSLTTKPRHTHFIHLDKLVIWSFSKIDCLCRNLCCTLYLKFRSMEILTRFFLHVLAQLMSASSLSLCLCSVTLVTIASLTALTMKWFLFSASVWRQCQRFTVMHQIHEIIQDLLIVKASTDRHWSCSMNK